MKLKSLGTLLAVAALAVGCGTCAGGSKGKPAEEFIASDASFVLSVPSTGTLTGRVQALASNLRSGPAGQRLVQAMANISRQLGFDPFTEEGLKSAGIDGSRSLAAGGAAGGRASLLLAIPVADQTKAVETLTRLVKDRTGAGLAETRTVAGARVTVLVREAGGAAGFAYALKDRYLLVSAGQQSPEEVAAALTRAPEQSIAQASAFIKSKERVGAREAYVMLPKAAAQRLAMMPDAAVLGLGVSADELSVRAFVALEQAQGSAVTAALVGGGRTLLTLLPEQSPLYLRGGLNLPAMLERFEKEGGGARQVKLVRDAAKEAGIDLDAELLANIEPGFALSVGISPNARLAGAFDFDPRRSNPFDTYTVFALGSVKDAAKAQETLAKLPAIADSLQVGISEREIGGTKVWTANYRLGEGLSWALVGQRLVVAGGLGESLEPLIASLAKGTQTVKPEAFGARAQQALFTDDGLALALDIGRVNELITRLPTSAFGQGAGGLMARSVATGMIAPLARLHGVVAITPADGGVLFDVTATARAARK